MKIFRNKQDGKLYKIYLRMKGCMCQKTGYEAVPLYHILDESQQTTCTGGIKVNSLDEFEFVTEGNNNNSLIRS